MMLLRLHSFVLRSSAQCHTSLCAAGYTMLQCACDGQVTAHRMVKLLSCEVVCALFVQQAPHLHAFREPAAFNSKASEAATCCSTPAGQRQQWI
jgi:hypothetical protein